MLNLEPNQGDASLIGWGGRKVTALTAALLNGTFIQGFELDDWHSEAPLHSNSIILPALLAATQQAKAEGSHPTTSGRDFLLAVITGYEIGPRDGRSLWGTHVLLSGWHSGAVFGPPAAAASVSKFYGLDAGTVEDTFGIACTQACGLMLAQFESDIKRMHHGFAARNGFLAAVLARGGYVGIKQVFERQYGGFLKQFSSGNEKQPQYRLDELTSELGSNWQTEGIRIKPYAAIAGTHPSIDYIQPLQEQHPERMKRFNEIKKINILLREAAFHHGGWKGTRPLTATGAQMIWRLIDLTDCKLHMDEGDSIGCQEVRIEFEDGTTLHHGVPNAFGVDPPSFNEDIVDKWRKLTEGTVPSQVVRQIEEMVVSLEEQGDAAVLCELLSQFSKSPLGALN
ncbi:hypothetical protein THAR02_11186 [Trichoderma harzianum]|uniref:MmgE/PrpD N-terminal domain-containing protein n=1 Tax=Trichoderma harzianum TaxID=5544 RepID=A0A0F9ZUG6_TRIHA|nr:hypothetical protein THAR02_11186 [Trichoderma harzianum]